MTKSPTPSPELKRLRQWRIDALAAAKQLLSDEYLERLKGESWWRGQMGPEPRRPDTERNGAPVMTQSHFLPTTGARPRS